MPQGGVDKNENFIDAMKRELMKKQVFKTYKILKELDGWFKYELPKNLIRYYLER